MSRALERQQRARAAEDLVAEYLARGGFSIVARNLRLGYLELDIVARRGDLVVIVEVRCRGRRSFTTAHGSVLGAKRQRLRRAARRLWKARYARDASVSRLRLDVAAVDLDCSPPRIDYAIAAIT